MHHRTQIKARFINSFILRQKPDLSAGKCYLNDKAKSLQKVLLNRLKTVVRNLTDK